jgi:hypothetical protein
MRDQAVSNAVAVLMMIATVAGVSAAVFLHAVYAGGGGPAKGLVLEAANGMPDSRTKEFHVANLTGSNLTWGSVTVEMDGTTLRYDGGEIGGSGFCVAKATGACTPRDSWEPFRVPVQVGQRVIVHGTALAGKSVNALVDGKVVWTGHVTA